MKNLISKFLLFSLLSLVFIACDKDDSQPNPPIISNINIIDMTYQNVTINWNVTIENSDEIIENGICWGDNSNPTIDSNKIKSSEKTGEQTLKIEDLENNKEIFIRTYSKTKYETVYSEELSFTLWLGALGEPITDVDGNTYQTVKIGNQVWMQENLKVTHYRNGEVIPMVSLLEDNKWTSAESGMYCKYEDNDKLGDYYGFLYNGYSVTDQRKIAPAGYNIPSDTDWVKLFNYLGGRSSVPEYLLMAQQFITGTNVPADALPNKQLYNFGGLASGIRIFNSFSLDKTTYSERTKKTIWWKNTGYDAIGVSRIEDYISYWQMHETSGLSIRCIKDSE